MWPHPVVHVSPRGIPVVARAAQRPGRAPERAAADAAARSARTAARRSWTWWTVWTLGVRVSCSARAARARPRFAPRSARFAPRSAPRLSGEHHNSRRAPILRAERVPGARWRFGAHQKSQAQDLVRARASET